MFSKIIIKKIIRWFAPLSALIIGFIWFVIWLYGYQVIRKLFDFPWGQNVAPLSPSLSALLIYNAIELAFIGLFFLGAIATYKLLIKDYFNHGVQRHLYAFSSSLSWAFLSFLAYGFSAFFCCPGLFPEVLNKYSWLPVPEFFIFYLFGQTVLLIRIYKKS